MNIMANNELKNKLSPAKRAINSYESLYYGVSSGDAQADEVLRAEMQSAFQRDDIVLADNPSKIRLRHTLADSYKQTAGALKGSDLDTTEAFTIDKTFETFESEHPDFYEKSFESFERQYMGEPVDFHADYARMVQDNNGVDPITSEITDLDIDVMAEAMGRSPAEAPAQAAGMSYAKQGATQPTEPKRTFEAGGKPPEKTVHRQETPAVRQPEYEDDGPEL